MMEETLPDPKNPTGGKLNNVYFSPPPDVKLNYPCIVYKQESREKQNADNRLYILHKPYSITYMNTRPDSNIPDKILEFPMSRQTQVYCSDGIYHYVYKLYI